MTSSLLGVALFLLGCAALREPDLERLYAAHSATHRTPVIVIPGVLGSRLLDRESGREMWPGGALDLLTGRQLRHLAVSTVDARPIADRLDPVAWDWRKDLAAAARQLDATIRQLRAQRADPNLRVDIVAHSAGGLVARYYVRFAARDVLDRDDPEALIDVAGSRAVRRVILIGTPNYGSVSALQGALMGARLGFASMQPELLATMPSLFELLPNPNRTWMIDVRGQRLDVDLYDVETWRRYQWSIFDPAVRERIRADRPAEEQGDDALAARESFFEAALTRGRRFHRALSVPLPEISTEFVVFGGDCDLTPARCLLETVDGRVTKASLLGRDSLAPDAPKPGFFPISYAVFICRGARRPALGLHVPRQPAQHPAVLNGAKTQRDGSATLTGGAPPWVRMTSCKTTLISGITCSSTSPSTATPGTASAPLIRPAGRAWWRS